MALPQTAAGVGAIGIDPPEDALAKISTVVDIFKWLGSADVLRELGLSSPLSASDTVTLTQLVPIVQLSDGYLDAQVQETFISAFLARLSIDWLMGVVDAFREVPPLDPVTPPSPVVARGKSKMSGCKQASPKASPKCNGRGEWLLLR